LLGPESACTPTTIYIATARDPQANNWSNRIPRTSSHDDITLAAVTLSEFSDIVIHALITTTLLAHSLDTSVHHLTVLTFLGFPFVPLANRSGSTYNHLNTPQSMSL
jgi:hypothetical protein